MNEFEALQHLLDQRLPSENGGQFTKGQPIAPDIQAVLSPLVDVAERLAQAPKPTLDMLMRERIEAKLLASIPVSQPIHPKVRPLHSYWWKMIAAVVALVIFTSSGAAYASQGALPGDTLYGVKRFTEDTRLALASDEGDVALHLQFAERRMSEFETLLARGKVDLAVLADANNDLSRAFDLTTHPSDFNRIGELNVRQGLLLVEAEQLAPASNDMAMVASGQETLGAGLAALTPTPTLAPTMTATVPESPIPTVTLVPSTETPIPPTSTLPAETGEVACVRGAGYWFTHPEAWGVESLQLGGQTYTQAELLTLSGGVRGDASISLARHLIAAKLNTANSGQSSSAVALADELFAQYEGKLPYTVAPSSEAGKAMLDLVGKLQAYNRTFQATDCLEPDPASTSDSSDNDGEGSDNINCNNPPPTHAPAEGWRERCEDGANDDKENNGKSNDKKLKPTPRNRRNNSSQD